MDHVEKAKDLFVSKQYHCSQSVFATFAEELGISEKQALRIGGCFAGGMRQGEVCGCVTGALMALGLKYGQCEVEDVLSRQKEDLIAQEFFARFAKENGSCLCRDLLGYDFSKPEEVVIIQTQKPYIDICPKLVESATRILEDLLMEDK